MSCFVGLGFPARLASSTPPKELLDLILDEEIADEKSVDRFSTR
jgi:hypothetical protein